VRIAHFYGHSGGNGVTSYIREVVDELSMRGHDVEVVCRADSPLVEAPKSTVYRISFGLRRLLLKQIREFRPDVVNVHSHDDAVVALRAARDSGVPTCYTTHETTNDSAQFAGLADVVIAVSHGVGRYLREEYRLSNRVVRVVPNGVDLKRLPHVDRAALRRENGFQDDEVVVCFAGRLVEKKNVRGLARAFGRVAVSRPELRLVVVGDGRQRRDVMRIVKELGVERRVDFRGWLPRDKALRVIGASDAFVLPAQEAEGLSIALLEAMAMAVPVIATEIPSLWGGPVRDGETGWLCAPDVDSLATTLERFASVSAAERAIVGRAGLLEIESNHRIESVANSLEDAYRAAIALKSEDACRATAGLT
jgi:glycosyltransferase involved in cell wall biosynthesis